MEQISLEEPVAYDLLITIVGQTWYGNLVGGMYEKRVTSEEFEAIKENPLQDYLEFGLQAVVFVDVQSYPEYRSGDYIIRSTSPEDDIISEWNPHCGYLKEKAEVFLDHLQEDYSYGNLEVTRIR